MCSASIKVEKGQDDIWQGHEWDWEYREEKKKKKKACCIPPTSLVWFCGKQKMSPVGSRKHVACKDIASQNAKNVIQSKEIECTIRCKTCRNDVTEWSSKETSFLESTIQRGTAVAPSSENELDMKKPLATNHIRFTKRYFLKTMMTACQSPGITKSLWLTLQELVRFALNIVCSRSSWACSFRTEVVVWQLKDKAQINKYYEQTV